VRVRSKELYELLRKPVDLEGIRPYVEHCERCMAAFLRGLADAEGSVDKDEEHFGHISIANTDRRLMEYAASLLNALGIFGKIFEGKMKEAANIEGRVLRRRRQFIYLLRIQRKADILRFREIVGFAIKRKQEVLDELHRRAITWRAGRPPKPFPSFYPPFSRVSRAHILEK